MHNPCLYSQTTDCLTIIDLALKNQLLISRSIDLGLHGHAQELRRLDETLTWLLKQNEPLSEAEQRAQGFTQYIWRTAGDDKVRPSHATNDGQVFSWDDPPPTGHPRS
ncbi:MAG: phage minor head protein [Alphaproteobacteria bacterium]